MLLRVIMFTTCMWLLTGYLMAQQPSQTIKGIVADNYSNIPIRGATVVVSGLNKTTITDSAGNFVLQKIPVGRYDIQVSFVGYETIVLKETVVSSGKEIFLTVSLKESANLLTEVVLQPRTNKQLPLNALATVSAKMLSVEEATRYAGGFDDPARLVSAFAGVSSNVNNNGLVVRGNSPKALQWKLEGVEISNPNHFADLAAFGGGGLTALSSQLLANSDFFSGAFPAEYNNALSGVFDIFMRKGNSSKREHTVQLGLTGIDVAAEGPFKKGTRSSYLFNYRYSTLALLQSFIPENGEAIKYQDFSFKLNFPTKKSGTFSIWGIGLMDNSGQKVKKNSNDWKYDADKEQQEVKQYMGAAGIGHKIFFGNKTYLKTTVAATMNGIDMITHRMNSTAQLLPQNTIKNKAWNIVASSFLNTKFNAKHTNKTGFTATAMMYDMRLQNSSPSGQPLKTIVDENGNSFLLSFFSNSAFRLNEKLTLNAGVTTQLFTLNKNYTVEPRAGMKYAIAPAQTISVAYGLHSRIERLNYYFSKNNLTGTTPVNKNMGFTKAHHLVLGYDLNISEDLHLKTEIYYQQLFNVPVIKDSSFSFLNLHNDWFFNNKLQNTGKGRNYGVDISLDKYMSKGYYYIVTASLFDAAYMGGDNIWRSTRYNRNYAFNLLAGKEWQFGKLKQKILGVNARITYQGGDRYSPVDNINSAATKDVVFDEKLAFSKQLPSSFASHITISYKINRSKTTQEIALKILNATAYKEFYGFRYNHKTNNVDEYRESIVIPNISYRVEF